MCLNWRRKVRNKMNTPDIFDYIFSTVAYWDHVTSSIGEICLSILLVMANCVQEACLFQSTADLTFKNSMLLRDETGILTTVKSLFFSEDITKIMQSAGNILILGLTIICLIKNLFANTKQYESPIKILGRSAFFTFLVSFYHIWVNALFKIVFFPISRTIRNIRIEDVDSAIKSKLATTGQGLSDSSFATDANSVDFSFISLSFIRAILLIIVAFPLIIQFCCLFVELIERFIHIFFLTLFGPLLLACGANFSTERISSTWIHVFINTIILLVVNLLMTKLSLIAFVNFMKYLSTSDGYATLKDAVIPYITLYVVIRISYKMDNIFNAIGLEALSATNMFEQVERVLKRLT